MDNDLSFEKLRRVNIQRCQSSEGFRHTLGSWRPSQWTNAMAGEVGEACNLAKKIDRVLDKLSGNRSDDQDLENLTERLADEVADVVIYADLTLARLNKSLAQCVRDKFNQKSVQIGSPHRL